MHDDLVPEWIRRALKKIVEDAEPGSTLDIHLRRRAECYSGPGLAALFSVSTDTIDRLRKAAGLPAHRIGREWRYYPAEVAIWLHHSQKKAKDSPPPD